MNKQGIIEHLIATNGNLLNRGWCKACRGNSREATHILHWLDEIGVSRKRHSRAPRKLACTLDEALDIIESSPYPAYENASAGKGQAGRYRSTETLTVTNDPLGIFEAGAVFPKSQIDDGEPLAPGELPDGLEFEDDKGDVYIVHPEKGLLCCGKDDAVIEAVRRSIAWTLNEANSILADVPLDWLNWFSEYYLVEGDDAKKKAPLFGQLLPESLVGGGEPIPAIRSVVLNSLDRDFETGTCRLLLSQYVVTGSGLRQVPL